MTMKLRGSTDEDLKSLEKSSWVVFQSEMFSAIHFVRLDLFKEDDKKTDNQTNGKEAKADFLNFREANNKKDKNFIEVILERANQGEDFFEKTSVSFSSDGTRAFINTPNEKFMVYLNEQNFGTVEKENSVRQLSEVTAFRHEKSAFIFAEYNELRQLTFKVDKKKFEAVIDASLIPQKKFKLCEADVIEIKEGV